VFFDSAVSWSTPTRQLQWNWHLMNWLLNIVLKKGWTPYIIGRHEGPSRLFFDQIMRLYITYIVFKVSHSVLSEASQRHDGD